MNKNDLPYKVFDTPMRPARWHVARWEGDDNATANFYRDRDLAEREALRRNKSKTGREEMRGLSGEAAQVDAPKEV